MFTVWLRSNENWVNQEKIAEINNASLAVKFAHIAVSDHPVRCEVEVQDENGDHIVVIYDPKMPIEPKVKKNWFFWW